MLRAKKITQRMLFIVVTFTEALPSELKYYQQLLEIVKRCFAMNVIQYYTPKFNIILCMNNR